MFKYLSVIVVALSFLASCATMPELNTNEKKLAAAEISFQEVGGLALRLAPQMDDETWNSVKDKLQAGYNVLTAARLYINTESAIDFDNRLSAVRSLISVLRPILHKIEAGEEISYGRSVNSFSPA